ncbi:cyclin family protein TDEL_0F03360 [Torulaspora delbrueckii]|uniref:Cyclin N-terminal domain-containing protein n=1 Tax=Torulaspora delbrueckii TaxID=4950 RepID=G8ZX03_TORDE|nr:hypothetical protein TDEL_0F03360 [Torulaspora delbrueckii]CCE93147.1 hypothetical protein TDEL_0F03360 [Torulaspora delbrueckii]
MASNDSLSNSSSNSNIKTDVSTTKTAALKRPSTVTEKVITPVATKSRRALTEVSVNNQISTFPDLDRVRRDNSDLTFVPLRKRQIYRDQENIEEEEQRPKRLKSDDSEECAWRDLDTDEKSDICMVVEYTNEIFSHLYKREKDTTPTHNYLVDTQSAYYLRPSMRAILIDWLVEVHEKFQCYPETLFLTINLMDRFLSKNKVTLSKLQLLAVTSLFIAAKFEEVNLPKLSDYAYITDGAASKNDIKNAEMFMLTSLEFNIGWPNPMNFLRRISKADRYDFQTRSIAKFLLEFIMCCHKFVDIKPSVTSAMAMFVAKKITEKDQTKPIWDETFKHYSGGIDPLNDSEFQSNCKKLIKEIANPTTKLDSLVLKFKKPRYGAIYFKVSQWCNNQVENNKHLDSLFSL